MFTTPLPFVFLLCFYTFSLQSRQSCPIAATPIRSRCVLPPKHDAAKPHCFLTQCPLNPEASHTNVLEETVSECMPPACHRSRQSVMGQGHPGRPNPPLTRTTLSQLCAASWVSRSRPAATELGLEPGSLVAQLALRCSALDHRATRRPPTSLFMNYWRYTLNLYISVPFIVLSCLVFRNC